MKEGHIMSAGWAKYVGSAAYYQVVSASAIVSIRPYPLTGATPGWGSPAKNSLIVILLSLSTQSLSVINVSDTQLNNYGRNSTASGGGILYRIYCISANGGGSNTIGINLFGTPFPTTVSWVAYNFNLTGRITGVVGHSADSSDTTSPPWTESIPGTDGDLGVFAAWAADFNSADTWTITGDNSVQVRGGVSGQSWAGAYTLSTDITKSMTVNCNPLLSPIQYAYTSAVFNVSSGGDPIFYGMQA